MNKLHFDGADFAVSASELSDNLRAALMDCGAPGDAQEAVDYVREAFTISGNPEACAAYLKGYGAWDAEELADHDRNLDRLVWLAGCDLREQGEIYFCTY
jgi:hypothetical protein